MNGRGSGILLPFSSLPSRFGLGDLGSSALKFVDFLVNTRQRYWQVLPVNPTDFAHGNSPYHCDSAFAFNPLLIDPENLYQEGWLTKEEVNDTPNFPMDRVDYPSVTSYKTAILKLAVERMGNASHLEGYEEFMGKNSFWLDDYSLFRALKSYFGGKPWCEWPGEMRDRQPKALEQARNEFAAICREIRLAQYLLHRQWTALRSTLSERGINIVGDVPIYLVHDSADVWVHPEFFDLDQEKMPTVVAGVPPDYFSETGQLWGNPVYRWEALKKQGYDWWIQRIRYNLELYDFIRIDHFRGFLAYWEVPVGEEVAVNGRWVKAPGWDFFNRVAEEFQELPIIAEDLGLITDDVRELIHHFQFPGMKVLLFAFGDDLATNPYAPHNIIKNCVVYTGTHDNNTTKGWFENEATPEMRKKLSQYVGGEVSADSAPKLLIRLAMMSVADTVIFPLQDVLELGEQARMNIPGTQTGNWEWRLTDDLLTQKVTEEFSAMTEIYGRG
ncbi:MAG: 4-alpha-glucanotransferase [Deltaproteobacteria bacterium]|nr:4-alpha-glucanotransferase [Deltaproteobacteria bacterium]